MPVVSIRHLTSYRYRYRNPVAFGEHRMMLRPLESYDQRLLFAELTISPEPSVLHTIHDVFGNCVGIARFQARADRICFDRHHPAGAYAAAGVRRPRRRPRRAAVCLQPGRPPRPCQVDGAPAP